MWDLPGPGIKPVSPALAGGFLTTVPPEKSLNVLKEDKQSGRGTYTFNYQDLFKAIIILKELAQE